MLTDMNLNDPFDTGLIMGIDLGTTNSAVAVHTTGLVPKLCPMGVGKITMPSCVRWNGGDSFTVGEEAYNGRYNKDTKYSVKRQMGTDDKIRLTTEQGQSRLFTPVEISAEILKELKKQANEYYPGVRRAVITVPAYFNQRQIEDTVTAANMADIECVQILKEPTSASYIYSMLGHAKGGRVLIYDLGGGTFDITHMSFLRKADIPSTVVTALRKNFAIDLREELKDDSKLYYQEVLGTYGDTHLGGDDIDSILADIVLREAKVSMGHTAKEMLKLKCEQFKKCGFEGQDFTVDGHNLSVNKAMLKEATDIIFARTMEIIKKIPEEDIEEISTIVLVGGSTKSQFIVDALSRTFPSKEISRVLDPDTTVALGAGAVAKDLAHGKAPAYNDVLPMAIGVLKDGAEVEVCVPSNTAMPHVVHRIYRTMHDNQEAISVDVFQGISTNPSECTFLGKLRIDGIPPKPAGEVEIGITFMLNAQGRLKVTTRVDDVNEERELIVESLFDVSSERKVALYDDIGEPADEFEEQLWDLIPKNPTIRDFILSRRAAIAENDDSAVDRIESELWEIL